jgi:formate C-acetyltransferase
MPVAVLKGKCFDFICRNMQIDVNPHDCYPGFACYDRIHRPMGNIIYARNIPRLNLKSLPEMDTLYKTGISSQWIDFDHSVPEWDNIMSLGFPGLKARARKYREQHEKNGTLTDKVAAYFDGIDITLQAVLDNIQRLIDFARERHTGNPRIEREIQCLEALLQGPPKDFYQALMITYLFFFYGEHIDHMQVRAMGNLDDMLYPYYLRDLASGRYTEEDMREFLACYLMQFGSINNYWGHPFYLGGTAEDGSSLYNPLSGIILDVFEELDITSPKIQLKIAKHTPDWILNKALGMVRKQNSALAFVGEENAINMLMQRYGATP